MSETISAKKAIFNTSTIKSIKATLAKGATAPNNDTVIPAGWPVVAKGNGQYEVFTKAAVVDQITGKAGTAGTSVTVLPKAIGILAEPITVASTMPSAKVVYCGDVYLDGLREATEIATTDIADYVFINSFGHINFIDKKDVQYMA